MKGDRVLTANSQVPEGYKQTEVGVIPEDWDALLLIECSRKITDGEHITPQREKDGYYLLSARNIQNGYIDLSDVDYVGFDEYLRIRKRCNPEPEDVLISCSGTIGRVTIVPHGLECVMVRSAALIKPDINRFNGRYIQYTLQATGGQKQIFSSLNQGAQANLFLNHIEKLCIPIPPTIAEQNLIASALSDTDALIESLEQLLAKKRQIKQGAMQELLSPKQGWEKTNLGSLGLFSKGSGVRKDESHSGNLPCIRYGEIYTHHNDYIKDFYSWISCNVANTATRLKSGDLLFAGSGETKEEIGKCVAFAGEIEAYAGGDIVILSPISSNSQFMGYYLNTEPIVRQKASKGQGDAVVHISANALASIQIEVPEVEEQTAIATILSDMDLEIGAIETKLTKARQLKQGMMHELLTGRIRLIEGAP
jgi:type I restriction enzyme, S subunit